MKHEQHIVPYGDKWAVRREGSERVTSVHPTQARAIKIGREIAQRQSTELFIHGRDGRIRNRNSFGHDPNPPKDQRY